MGRTDPPPETRTVTSPARFKRLGKVSVCSMANRMRYPLELFEALRAASPVASAALL
jgi:hypothetical protein